MRTSSGRAFRAVTLAATVAVVLLACNKGKEPAPKTPLSEVSAQSGGELAAGSAGAMSAEARVVLDSGNALYRAKKYADALAQYRIAAQRAPEDPAPYFGIYMVAGATGNKRLQDSAQAALRARGMIQPEGPHVRADSVRK
jgi:hypothetical protein